MREILFRGKRISDNTWVYGGIMKTFHPNFEHESVEAFVLQKENCYCICANGKDYFVGQESIGQYTGLRDNTRTEEYPNGKKIFEGDILKGKHQWRNWNTSFGNDEKDFLEQKIRGAYGKYIDKTANEFIKGQYHYFRNYAVEYYAPNGGYRVRNGGQFHRLDQSYIFNRELEIIGNIHDNPELLRKEDEGKCI